MPPTCKGRAAKVCAARFQEFGAGLEKSACCITITHSYVSAVQETIDSVYSHTVAPSDRWTRVTCGVLLNPLGRSYVARVQAYYRLLHVQQCRKCGVPLYNKVGQHLSETALHRARLGDFQVARWLPQTALTGWRNLIRYTICCQKRADLMQYSVLFGALCHLHRIATTWRFVDATLSVEESGDIRIVHGGIVYA